VNGGGLILGVSLVWEFQNAPEMAIFFLVLKKIGSKKARNTQKRKSRLLKPAF